MHHSVKESPEQDISEKTSHKASSEEQPPGFKEFVPSPSGLENEQQRQEKCRQEIKNETIQSRQAQDAGCCSRQSGYRGAAVVQHGSVAPHSHFTDELWSFTLGYNSCHGDSGHQTQDGAGETEIDVRAYRLLAVWLQKHDMKKTLFLLESRIIVRNVSCYQEKIPHSF